MVVLGNPPYSGLSANMSESAIKLVDAYKFVDGQPLGERKHWLQDDYVKFIRFAQTRIERTGHGILAFISNHGYLDNPTFRGMRQSLMETFDEIFVLDLHGNAKKREQSPDGNPDKNVFDIQQGVTIGIFVRHAKRSDSPSKVHHADLWGSREAKYLALSNGSLSETEWANIKAQEPMYLFKPQDCTNKDEYELGWSISKVFPVNSSGVVTARDHFVIDLDEESLLKRLQDLQAKVLRSTNPVIHEVGNCRWLESLSSAKNTRLATLLQFSTGLSIYGASTMFRIWWIGREMR